MAKAKKTEVKQPKVAPAKAQSKEETKSKQADNGTETKPKKVHTPTIPRESVTKGLGKWPLPQRQREAQQKKEAHERAAADLESLKKKGYEDPNTIERIQRNVNRLHDEAKEAQKNAK